MEIRLLQLLDGARQAEGLTVIIDVFRAFSLECYMMEMGAAHIYPVGEKEIAYRWKEEHPDVILVGERKGVILPGFDYGNSPSQIASADLSGKTIIHTTSAGTQGIVNACNADEIITGSLVNASAIANYIQSKKPKTVSLVCMGLAGQSPTEEDTLCGAYIKSLLEGQPIALPDKIEQLKTTSGAKFFVPENQNVFPMQDFTMCTAVNRFPFVLKVKKLSDGKFETCRIS